MFENFTWPSIMKIPPQNFFLDKSQSIFLDISYYFLATPLKMRKYNFLNFQCFPEKFFIDPRDHINICKDFGNLKRFQCKKKLDSRPTDMLYGSYFSHTTIG